MASVEIVVFSKPIIPFSMSEFSLYFNLGLDHVLDWQAYDHVLFLLVLVAAYSFNSWKRVLGLVSLFTLGHTLSLFLSVYGVVRVNSGWVEALIALTIFITALYNIITAKRKEHHKNMLLLYITTALFGIVHGLGFSSYFKMISSNITGKFVPLLEFSLGIESAQIIVVITALIFAFIFQSLLKVNRRDWILVISAIVIGVISPILIENIKNLI